MLFFQGSERLNYGVDPERNMGVAGVLLGDVHKYVFTAVRSAPFTMKFISRREIFNDDDRVKSTSLWAQNPEFCKSLAHASVTRMPR